MTPSVSFIEVDGVRLRLATAGKGPPLLFLFGSGAAGNIDRAKPFINRFSKHFSVACPDQRGLGQSDIPAGPWTMADYARDAFGVADHLSWEKFAIIGISFGGMVALEMGATDPDRISGMVLWGTCGGGKAHSYPLHLLAELPAEERNRRFAELMDTRLDGRWDEADPSPEVQLVKAVLEHGGSPWSVAAHEDQGRNQGLALQLKARHGHNVMDRLGRITCPVLIGAGTYDGLAPIENVEKLNSGLPNSELCVYDAGHFFYLGARAFHDGISFLTDTALPPEGIGGRPLTGQQLADRLKEP